MTQQSDEITVDRSPHLDGESQRGASTGRLLAGGALALVIVALLVVFFTRDDSYSYRVHFENAGQLVRGDLARIGGTPVGEVTDIQLSDEGMAEVTVSVAKDFAPLRAGTTAMIRAQGLIGTANRFVDISPAPSFKRELADGAVIKPDQTQSIVELDQFFNTLDPKSRKGLDGIIHGFADWYAGREKEASKTALYFPPALTGGTRLFREINRDSEVFEDFLVESAKAMGALAERRTEVTELVSNTGTTLDALGSDTEALNEVLEEFPPALKQGAKTFATLRGPAIDSLEKFVVESDRSAEVLPPFLRRFRPFVAQSVPTFKSLTLLFNGPGPGNDLHDTMRDLPPLDKLASTAFPRARESLRQSTPIFGFFRPYIPDLVAWLRSFGGAMGTYDANGHYARTMPVFDAFNFTDSAEGGTLTPKSPADRGKSPYLDRDNLRRCPGTGAPNPPDGSAPFVDSGELSNPDCDPSQVVQGTP